MYWVEIRKKKALYDGRTQTYNKYWDEGIVDTIDDFKTIKEARKYAVQYLRKHKMYYGGQSGHSYDTIVHKYRQPIGVISLFHDSHASWKGGDSGKTFRILSDGTLKQNPIIEPVAAISAGIVDGEVKLDLNYEEDSHAQVDSNVVLTKSGKIIEFQTTAEGKPYEFDKMIEIFDIAKKGILQIIEKYSNLE